MCHVCNKNISPVAFEEPGGIELKGFLLVPAFVPSINFANKVKLNKYFRE